LVRCEQQKNGGRRETGAAENENTAKTREINHVGRDGNYAV
jgi:hypothetical protein